MYLHKIIALAASPAHVQAISLVNLPTVLNEATGEVLVQVHSRVVAGGTLKYWSEKSTAESLVDADWIEGWDDFNGEWDKATGEYIEGNKTTTAKTNGAVKRLECGPVSHVWCGNENWAHPDVCRDLIYEIMAKHPEGNVEMFKAVSYRNIMKDPMDCWVGWRNLIPGLQHHHLYGPASNAFDVCTKDLTSGWTEGVKLAGRCTNVCVSGTPYC